MRAVVVVALVGCSFPAPSKDYACDTTADCESGRVCTNNFCVVSTQLPDATPEVDTPEQVFDCTVWTAPRHFMPCDIPEPTGALDLATAGTYLYDTTTGTLADPGGAMTTPPTKLIAAGRVISVSSFNVGANVTLRVVGMQPLIVASWSTLTVAGAIDASSNATTAGAGANPATCAARAAAPGGNNDSGAGGGGGGGFRGTGGTGGDGDAANGGAGGNALAQPPLLAGGCTGATGGTGNEAGGAGGRGGGAVQLTAKDSITISGRVHAGGSGGGGATATVNEADGGGGGGGSGGMIGLEAPALSLAATAIVAANGGGGGAGVDSAPGARGQDGQPSATRATGGPGNNAGSGGLGSGGLILGGGNGQNDGSHGGGGAGGGAGHIVFVGTSSIMPGAIVSPIATGP